MAFTDDVEFELADDPEDDGYHGIGTQQWMLLCPHLSAGDKILFSVVRSLVNPYRGDRYRKLSLTDIMAFLPSVPVELDEDPKLVARATLIRGFTSLNRMGQVVSADGAPLVFASRTPKTRPDASMRIKVFSRPMHACGAHRNIREALAYARGEQLRYPPAGSASFLLQTGERPSTTGSVAAKMMQSASEMTQSASEMMQESGADLGFSAPSMLSSMLFPTPPPGSGLDTASEPDPADACGAEEKEDAPAALEAPALGDPAWDATQLNLLGQGQHRPRQIPAVPGQKRTERPAQAPAPKPEPAPEPAPAPRASNATPADLPVPRTVESARKWVQRVNSLAVGDLATSVMNRLKGRPNSTFIRARVTAALASGWSADDLVEHLNRANTPGTPGIHGQNLKELPEPPATPSGPAKLIDLFHIPDDATRHALDRMVPNIKARCPQHPDDRVCEHTHALLEQRRTVTAEMVDALVRWAQRAGFRAPITT